MVKSCIARTVLENCCQLFLPISMKVVKMLTTVHIIDKLALDHLGSLCQFKFIFFLQLSCDCRFSLSTWNLSKRFLAWDRFPCEHSRGSSLEVIVKKLGPSVSLTVFFSLELYRIKKDVTFGPVLIILDIMLFYLNNKVERIRLEVLSWWNRKLCPDQILKVLWTYTVSKVLMKSVWNITKMLTNFINYTRLSSK